ncbi:unnamed protein product [Cylindrotheca closterium]|uniref:Sec-independent protein translocase protein TatB n=1 Tax=Cylindrotheca closterium TaxID=2856 RepID=A0AAD2FR31_9STRA|nr:unnamed protein product [Cylindrotheca closterium]
MFDVSWGELLVLGSVGAALAGRRDLPSACRFAGMQVGRVVGLLQGARARADQFSTQNELRQLQNELRSGLRELDQVKTELVVAASMGRTLGATTPSANRLVSNKSSNNNNNNNNTNNNTNRTPYRTKIQSSTITAPQVGNVSVSTASKSRQTPPQPTISTADAMMESLSLSPSSIIQSERASMEEEWEKQGISFRSAAEQGSWMNTGNVTASSSSSTANTGSEILENLMHQNLVFDQYNRVVANQEHEMQQRIEQIKAKGRNHRTDEKK